MEGTGYACTKPAERACTHCGRFFCQEHGKIGITQVAVCGACLSAQKRTWAVILFAALGGVVLRGLYWIFW
jgi:hypothetical protein